MSQTDEFSELTAFAHRLADAAGAVIRPYFRAVLDVDNKQPADFDPVTEADRAAEETIRSLIRDTYPDHGIIGEEQEDVAGGRYTWVIDPIDGTRSFIAGFPTWGTLIALGLDGRPVVGIMDQPFTGERFVGVPGGASFGDKSLRVRSCSNLSEAVLFSTTPDMFKSGEETAAFQRVEDKVKLRRWGGDCYSYCMLAHGLVDLVIEASMAPYDIQALIPIVEGAGGILTTWDGEPAWDGGRLIAAGDKRVYDQAMVLLNGG